MVRHFYHAAKALKKRYWLNLLPKSFDQSVVSKFSKAHSHKCTVFSNSYSMLLAQPIFFQILLQRQMEVGLKGITASMFIPFKAKIIATGRKGGIRNLQGLQQ